MPAPSWVCQSAPSAADTHSGEHQPDPARRFFPVRRQLPGPCFHLDPVLVTFARSHSQGPEARAQKTISQIPPNTGAAPIRSVG
jgi:hypothetical protein